MPNTQGVTAIIVYVFRVPHSCQVGALLSALFHCHRPVAFTGAIHALQALFASEVVHTKGVLVDLLCEPNTGLDRTAALRFTLVSELAHIAGLTDTHGPYGT
jgi:hypothetical protein